MIFRTLRAIVVALLTSFPAKMTTNEPEVKVILETRLENNTSVVRKLKESPV